MPGKGPEDVYGEVPYHLTSLLSSLRYLCYLATFAELDWLQVEPALNSDPPFSVKFLFYFCYDFALLCFCYFLF